MKTKLKALLHNRLFEKIIHQVPFIYPAKKLQAFDELLLKVKEVGPDKTSGILHPYEQRVNIEIENNPSYRVSLLQFLPITLVNPPEAWDKYYKKLFQFDKSGKINHNQYLNLYWRIRRSHQRFRILHFYSIG